MSLPSQRNKVTVEDLLQLKRAERPEPEFWNKFEVELRQKQLAALVERRPWWQQLPHLLSRRAYIPLGATAVMAFTLVSVRYHQPEHTIAPVADEFATPVSTASVAPVVPRHDMVSAVAQAPAIEEDNSPLPIDDRTAVAALPLSERLPARTGELVPWSAPRVEETPSARSIAANLARLEENDPELANRLLAAGLNHTSQAVQASSHAVEMAAVSAFASRHNRLMAQLTDRQFTPDPSAPEVVRERLSRRLGDTELAGGWTRVGVKGDRVSLKF